MLLLSASDTLSYYATIFIIIFSKCIRFYIFNAVISNEN